MIVESESRPYDRVKFHSAPRGHFAMNRCDANEQCRGRKRTVNGFRRQNGIYKEIHDEGLYQSKHDRTPLS
jgi:hypothetical protein